MTVSRWKRRFLENGPAVLRQDTTLAAYEKKIKEMERPLGRKAMEIALLQDSMDGSSSQQRRLRS